MWQGNCGGGYCYPTQCSQADEIIILKEKEKILEAKLATIRHMIETLEKEEKVKEKA